MKDSENLKRVTSFFIENYEIPDYIQIKGRQYDFTCYKISEEDRQSELDESMIADSSGCDDLYLIDIEYKTSEAPRGKPRGICRTA